jgi:hypothetical protein
LKKKHPNSVQGKTVAGFNKGGLPWLRSSKQHRRDIHPRGPSTSRQNAVDVTDM